MNLNLFEIKDNKVVFYNKHYSDRKIFYDNINYFLNFFDLYLTYSYDGQYERFFADIIKDKKTGEVYDFNGERCKLGNSRSFGFSLSGFWLDIDNKEFSYSYDSLDKELVFEICDKESNYKLSFRLGFKELCELKKHHKNIISHMTINIDGNYNPGHVTLKSTTNNILFEKNRKKDVEIIDYGDMNYISNYILETFNNLFNSCHKNKLNEKDSNFINSFVSLFIKEYLNISYDYCIVNNKEYIINLLTQRKNAFDLGNELKLIKEEYERKLQELYKKHDDYDNFMNNAINNITDSTNKKRL